MDRAYHVPVLADEIVDLLDPRSGQTFVDGTLGGGGHASRLAERLHPGGRLVVIDRDPAALEAARNNAVLRSIEIIAVHGDFRNMPSLLREHGIGEVAGILLDLGVSSHQLDTPDRGFSFRADAALDMRMDTSRGETAAELLARADERELTRIIREYGEERWAARIAAFIVDRRKSEPLRTTAQLAALVEAAMPRGAWPRDIHPATRAFQGLRIAVNDELGALEEALEGGAGLLTRGGRIAIISYHSLEDRLVKQTFIRLSGRCQCPPGLPVCRCGALDRPWVLQPINRKPILPTDQEVKRNPRARSARLRAAEKVIARSVDTTAP